MKNFLRIFVVLLSVAAMAQDLPPLPPAPQPKPQHQNLKFVIGTVFLAGGAFTQVRAEHHGAELCKDESLRNGIPWTSNSSSVGFRPDRADRRTAFVAGGMFLGAGIAKLTHHPVFANRILFVGGVVLYSTGGATEWAGCN